MTRPMFQDADSATEVLVKLGELGASVQHLLRDFADEKIAARDNRAAVHRRLDEARAFLANPSLTAAECPHIYAGIGITGEDAEAVAQVVVGMHAAWQVKSADIEHKRLAAKAAIDAAETAEAISLATAVDWQT